MIKNLLWVVLGSGLGGAARFWISEAMRNSTAGGFPRATFIINIVGSFLIGIFWTIAEKNKTFSPELFFFLMTGICGGFTTFSAFSLDNMKLIKSGAYFTAAIYTGGSVVLGLIALWIGAGITKNFS